MRLFIAFEVPDDISILLSKTQKQLVVPGKATITKSFHLTLKFLGEVPEEKLPALKKELSKISFESFTAKLSGIGAFPDTKDPKVVWVGLEPHDTINNIQHQVDKAAQEAGFPAETRFHPHLTLARIKFLKDKIQFQKHLENLKAPEAEFTLSSFKLIKSTLTPEGPKYELIHTFSSQQ